MKRTCRYTRLLVVFALVVSSISRTAAQPEHNSHVRDILSLVESGIVESNVSAFSKYLGSQVAISMKNDWGGSYSANQSISILKNFFGMRKTIGFQFTTIQESVAGAYGTGGGSFVLRGAKENLQIYVRLSLIEKKWSITQINIY